MSATEFERRLRKLAPDEVDRAVLRATVLSRSDASAAYPGRRVSALLDVLLRQAGGAGNPGAA